MKALIPNEGAYGDRDRAFYGVDGEASWLLSSFLIIVVAQSFVCSFVARVVPCVLWRLRCLDFRVGVFLSNRYLPASAFLSLIVTSAAHPVCGGPSCADFR